MARLDRLRELRDFFAGIDAGKVNMDYWWCGTDGCLAGWACQMPQFNADGLIMRTSPHRPRLLERAYDSDNLPTASWRDLAEFFGITYDESVAVFNSTFGLAPYTQESKDRAMARLVELIERYESMEPKPEPKVEAVQHEVVEEPAQQEPVRTPIAN